MMGVDWKYLHGVSRNPDSWGDEEIEELYQTLARISSLRSSDKEVGRLELLFTLTQAVMTAKQAQVTALEEAADHMAEAAGREDAHREQKLLAKIESLKAKLKFIKTHNEDSTESDVAYDWSSEWKLKKKQLEEALQHRNVQLQQFMEDLEEVTAEKKRLQSTVEELETHLAAATKEINQLTADYTTQNVTKSHLQESLKVARDEVSGLQCRNQELMCDKVLLQQKYENLSSAVDARIEQLKIALSGREEELRKVRAEVHQRSSVPLQPPVVEHTVILELEKKVEERNKEVNRLQTQLAEATQEINSCAQLITTLKRKRSLTEDDNTSTLYELRQELHEAKLHNEHLRKQLVSAEEDAQAHAHDLSVVIGELQLFMAGEFSLADAVKELKETRGQVRIRDSQLVHLTALVNSFQMNINDILDENVQLREQLKLEPREDIDLPGVNKTHLHSSKQIVAKLKDQIASLQNEKVTLKTKVYDLTRQLSINQSSLQLTTIEAPGILSTTETSGGIQALEEQLQEVRTLVTTLVNEREENKKEKLDKEVCMTSPDCKSQSLQGEEESLEHNLSKVAQDSCRQTADQEQHVLKDQDEEQTEPKKTVIDIDQQIAALGELSPSAEEIIAKLRTQVNFLMQKCNKKECELREKEETSHLYVKQFNDLHSQVSSVTHEFTADRESWLKEKSEMEKEITDNQAEVHARKTQVQELEGVVDSITSGKEGVDGQVIKQMAVHKYELEISKRLNTIQQQQLNDFSNRLLQKEEDAAQIIKKNKEKENKHEQERIRIEYRLGQLDRALKDSIPINVANQTTSQLATMTAKYRAVLHDQMQLRQVHNVQSQLEAQVRQLEKDNQQLCQLLESARDKVYSLTASLRVTGNEISSVQVNLLSKQLAAVELRELQEKQKAEHAQVMYFNIKEENEALRKRLEQVEKHLNDVMSMNASLQATELDLREKAHSAVTQTELQHVKNELEAALKEKSGLCEEVERLHGIVEVSTTQLQQMELQKTTEQAVVKQLQQEANDLASLSDERAKIAALHQDIIALKVKNLELEVNLEKSETTLEKHSRHISNLEYHFKERNVLLETAVDSARTRATRLYAVIRDLRHQYAGAIPLVQQEHLSEIVKGMEQERNSLQEALEKAQQDKVEAHLTLKQLKVKQESLDDLKSALSSEMPQRHISEWSGKLEDIKMQKLEVDEKFQSATERLTLLGAQLENKDLRIKETYQQLLHSEKLWTEQQLAWEARELELTQALERHEQRQQDVSLDQPFIEDLFDSSQPLALRLENAMEVIQKKTGIIERLSKKSTELQDVLNQCQLDLKAKEAVLLAKDKLINDLRVMSAKVGCDDTHEENTGKYVENYEDCNKGVHVVISGLKERLHISQEAVMHYKELLISSSEEQKIIVNKLQSEFSQISSERDQLLLKVRNLQDKLDTIPTKDVGPLNETCVSQIHTLEDTVKTQDAQLKELHDKLLSSHTKIVQLEREQTMAKQEHIEIKEQLEVSSQVRTQQHQREVERLGIQYQELYKEKEELQRELAVLRESANRTPSAILRTLVEKLRDQLIEKEKQIVTLSHAVKEMKDRFIADKEETNEYEDSEKKMAKAVDEATSELSQQLKKIELDKEDLEKGKILMEATYKEENDNLKKELQKSTEEQQKIKSQTLDLEKQCMQQKKVITDLKKKLDDLQGRTPEAVSNAIEKLKIKLERMVGAEEFQAIQNKKAKSQEQVIRWEERKKVKTSLEKLKTRIRELEDSHAAMSTKLGMSKDLLSRVEKEKLNLLKKLDTINKASAEKLCSVCLKTLTPLEGSAHKTSQENLVATPMRILSRNVSPTEKKSEEKSANNTKKEIIDASSEDLTVSPAAVQQRDREEMKMRAQLKRAIEDKHKLEGKLKNAFEEIASLRTSLNAQMEKSEKSPTRTNARLPGAALVLQYENRIKTLEDEIHQKARLLAHVKSVVCEAAAREELLTKERQALLHRVTLLESVQEDTPAARLVQELRQAKMTINRLQREIDAQNIEHL
ncbi:centrosomal protein of 290 kDa-like [Oratosquilla oratoria]|uniref:centrosomal protein of 290 kDa-like n=1 Tax=Oratosquilla oratoria TaxID=337810 RepID=UPI003F768F0E